MLRLSNDAPVLRRLMLAAGLSAGLLFAAPLAIAQDAPPAPTGTGQPAAPTGTGDPAAPAAPTGTGDPGAPVAPTGTGDAGQGAAPVDPATGNAIPIANGVPAPALAEETPAIKSITPWTMFMMADIVVKTVMIGLILSSIIVWTITIQKSLFFGAINRRSDKFLQVFRATPSLFDVVNKIGARDKHPMAEMLRAAVDEMNLTLKAGAASTGEKREHLTQRIAASMGVAQNSSSSELGWGMTFLSIIGSAAVYVGLFGTVWGIMNSFIGIANTQTTNLAVVAPGIAEALFATAIGLFAAIPAVAFYNMFARRLSMFNTRLENFSGELLTRVSRQLDMGA